MPFAWGFPMPYGALEGYQGHELVPSPFDAPLGHSDQPVPEAAFQEAGPQSVPEASTSSDGQGGDDSDGDSWKVVTLCGDVPHFCRVGHNPYRHTELKQIKCHRGGHFKDRYCWSCPDQTDTRPGFGGYTVKSTCTRRHSSP